MIWQLGNFPSSIKKYTISICPILVILDCETSQSAWCLIYLGTFFVDIHSSSLNQVLGGNTIYWLFIQFKWFEYTETLTKQHKLNFRSNISLFLIRDGADDLSEQSHERPAAEYDSAAAGTAKSGQHAGRWIQKFHFMRDKWHHIVTLFFPHRQETKHTLVVSLSSQLWFYCPPCEKKQEAAKCKHRFRLVESNRFTALNARGQHCWWCVATGIGCKKTG